MLWKRKRRKNEKKIDYFDLFNERFSEWSHASLLLYNVMPYTNSTRQNAKGHCPAIIFWPTNECWFLKVLFYVILCCYIFYFCRQYCWLMLRLLIVMKFVFFCEQLILQWCIGENFKALLFRTSKSRNE